jgi:hypothetical protein
MCCNSNLLHFELQVLCYNKELCVSCCSKELHILCCYTLSYNFHVVTFQTMGFVLLHFKLQVLHWSISSYRFRVLCVIATFWAWNHYTIVVCFAHVMCNNNSKKHLELKCQIFLLISSFWLILHFFMELFMSVVCNNCSNNNCFEFCRSFKWYVIHLFILWFCKCLCLRPSN